MKTLNIHEAKTKLSSVLAKIEKKGKKFLICRNGKPISDLIPHKKKSTQAGSIFEPSKN
jgi:antitoxin (DNA-binding transcriptional repressor) of toxin-antitoxin stability system